MKIIRFALLVALTLAVSAMGLAGCSKAAAKAPVSNPTDTAPAAISTSGADIAFDVVTISDAHPGDDVTVTVKTAPGATVKIVFTMPSGTVSSYPSDNTKTAGADGIITWTWNINSHIGAGEATYSFNITLNGQTKTASLNKTI
jgi:hypothetical protein